MKNIREYDYCIVGTGIAGGTIAKLLSETNKSIVIVEKGSNHHEKPNFISKGRDFGLRTTTSIQIGGTSNLWHGVLSFLDLIDFSKRSWIKKSGWPINFKELVPYYNKISSLFGIEDFDFFDKNKLNDNLSNELESIPFNRQILKNKMFQQPLDILNFKKTINLLSKKNNITLLKNHTACKFVLSHDSVDELVVANHEGFIKIKSKFYILCAGALESPRLLLNSSIDNINIGKYLMDHPMGNLCQVKFKKPQKAQIYSAKKYKKGIAIKTGLVFSDELQSKQKIPNHCFYLRPSFSRGLDNKSEKVKLSLLTFKDGNISFKDVFYVLRNFNIAFQILTYKLSYNATYKYADLFFVSEQTPSEDSYVKLSKTENDRYGFPLAEVNWNVSDYDIKSVEKCYKILKEIGFSEQDYEFTHNFNDLDWKTNFTSAAHHVGTCRMAENKNDGVVDKNLKVFDLKNLYVCDGSVFPTGGNVNNGFTVAALASRLTNHLLNKNG